MCACVADAVFVSFIARGRRGLGDGIINDDGRVVMQHAIIEPRVGAACRRRPREPPSSSLLCDSQSICNKSNTHTHPQKKNYPYRAVAGVWVVRVLGALCRGKKNIYMTA